MTTPLTENRSGNEKKRKKSAEQGRKVRRRTGVTSHTPSRSASSSSSTFSLNSSRSASSSSSTDVNGVFSLGLSSSGRYFQLLWTPSGWEVKAIPGERPATHSTARAIKKMTEKLNEVLAVLPPAVTNWIDQYASGMTQTEMHADISHVISVDEFKQFIAVAMQEASTITDEATREKLVSELAEDISGIVSSDDEEGQRRVRELTRTALGPITVMDVATAQTRLKAADELLGRLAGTSRNIRWGLDIINRAIGAYRDLFFQNDGELVKYVNERIRRFERAQRRIRMQSYQPLQRGKNGISSSTTTEAEFNLTKRSGKKSKNAQSARAVKKKPDIVNSNDTRVDSLTQNTVLSQMVPGNSGNAPMRLPASRINVSPPEFTSQSATNPLPNPGQPFSLMRPDQVGVSISSQLSANMSSQLGTEMPSAATQVSVEEVLSKFVFDL